MIGSDSGFGAIESPADADRGYTKVAMGLLIFLHSVILGLDPRIHAQASHQIRIVHLRYERERGVLGGDKVV